MRYNDGTNDYIFDLMFSVEGFLALSERLRSKSVLDKTLQAVSGVSLHGNTKTVRSVGCQFTGLAPSYRTIHPHVRPVLP